MKVMDKYFLAVLPPAVYLDQVEELKRVIHERFGCKYARKSPAHVTLKMPFSFSAKREEHLKESLTSYFSTHHSFRIGINQVGTFGRRVIYLKVNAPQAMIDMQAGLKTYCQRELHLLPELSDRNYHPHMTVAFKDLKASYFDDLVRFLKLQKVGFSFDVDRVFLLRKAQGIWEPIHEFALLG